MIDLENVFAGYGGGDVLQGLDLHVRPGSITCIVGPNGAGKSTVLRAISGLLWPRQGRVCLERRWPSTASRPSAVIAAGVVQVPQQGGLFSDMTVRDNMLLGGYAHPTRQERGSSDASPSSRRRFRSSPNGPHDKAGDLSGGQRRIVEFARALVTDPKVVLLDEPTLGLDPKTCEIVFDTTKTINELGATVLMVEQNVRFGLKLATDGVVMERGTVLLAEPAADLLARPDMAAMFFGSGPGAPVHTDGTPVRSDAP